MKQNIFTFLSSGRRVARSYSPLSILLQTQRRPNHSLPQAGQGRVMEYSIEIRAVLSLMTANSSAWPMAGCWFGSFAQSVRACCHFFELSFRLFSEGLGLRRALFTGEWRLLRPWKYCKKKSWLDLFAKMSRLCCHCDYGLWALCTAEKVSSANNCFTKTYRRCDGTCALLIDTLTHIRASYPWVSSVLTPMSLHASITRHIRLVRRTLCKRCRTGRFHEVGAIKCVENYTEICWNNYNVTAPHSLHPDHCIQQVCAEAKRHYCLAPMRLSQSRRGLQTSFTARCLIDAPVSTSISLPSCLAQTGLPHNAVQTQLGRGWAGRLHRSELPAPRSSWRRRSARG